VSLTKIKFPVLKSLRIEQYQLFPGKDKKGISHTFLPGITVIAGINGLGKTTLLNVMLRCLTGTREPKKFDPYNPAGGVHDMISTKRDVDYFAQRVLDEAHEATVEAEFYFGNNEVRIKRSLNDLRILGLWKNDHEVTGNQSALQNAIVKLSGAGDEYDFFYVIRSFTFFLEDKVSLIWNPQGQFEIFRILFFQPQQARDLAQLADSIRRLDSKYRNQRFQLNKRRKKLEKSKRTTNDLSDIEKAIQKRQVAIDDLNAQLSDHNRKIEVIIARRAVLTEKTEKIHLDIEEVTRSYQALVETFFTTAFPSLSATTQLILNNITSGTGCLVCDNPDPQYPKIYLERASKGSCPFCGNDTTKRRPPRMNASKRRNLHNDEERLHELHNSRDVLQRELSDVLTNLDHLYEEKSHLTSDFVSCKNKLDALRTQLPPSEEERDQELMKINEEQAELDDIREDRDAKTREYEKMLDQVRKTVETVKERLTELFAYYAGEFLAEKCTLNWEPAKRRLGEEGKLLDFPQFTVEMTSALSQATGSPRKEENQVSESQKEFIDLAFRMALFDAVRDKGERAMLVIETPEASLDAVFVDQAGQLLRRFAHRDKNAHNVVIATINLNRENMLRSLLGLDEEGNEKGKREAPERVINLLEEAAPNAALRKYRAKYETSYAKAMNMEK